MSLDPAKFPPAQAWSPLKAEDWNTDAARHLLHRIGFSATPDRVLQTYKQGLQKTLQDAFGSIRPFAMPDSLAHYTQRRADLVNNERMMNTGIDTPAPTAAPTATTAASPAATAATGAPRGARGARGGRGVAAGAANQRQFQMELNQLQRQAYLELVPTWLAFAAKPENSAQENLVMFLSNVMVVGQSKVKDPQRLYAHANLLRANYQKSYPDMLKAVTYSPAMIEYLDLATSSVGVPNENYARELMELFALGIGHYTESDVKEAARALTGIVINQEEGFFAKRRWDNGMKTIFGQTGRWGAEDVVDLIFTQPGARNHLPKRFLTYYLAQDPLPQAYLDELGHQWQSSGFRVDILAQKVFASQLFYRPEFRAVQVKSPNQYYLGLCQDLSLDVSPLEGMVYNNLRNMGQEPFNPPNVRGWLGGKNWINSSTLAARRQLVQQLFNPVLERNMTADQLMKLDAARKDGHGAIVMDNPRLENLAAKSNEEIADQLLNFFLNGTVADAYRRDIIDYMANDQGQRVELVRDVATALFQSPQYHLC